jgi:hypothetical protein
VIRVYDESGNVIQAHEHKGEFREWVKSSQKRLETGREKNCLIPHALTFSAHQRHCLIDEPLITA